MEELFGIRTKVRLVSGEMVDGWYYAKERQGLYLALDPDGEDIRFIPRGEWTSASYNHEAETARFRPSDFRHTVETYWALRDDLWRPMSHALNRVDLNHVRRIGLKMDVVRGRLDSPHHWHRDAPLPWVLEARESHAELLEEITESGIGDILTEKSNQIRKILSENTIPSIDAYIVHPSEIRSMIELSKETDNLAETNSGKKYLDKLSPEVLSAEESTDQPGKNLESRGEEKKTSRLRSAAAWLKITSGGGLAATNITLGALAGVASVIPTLGLGTVAAVVGIATSTFAGLNTASDALKDMAANRERK